MTYRPSDSSSRDCYSQPQSRLSQQIRCDSNRTDEGCPVLEESGTVCGETNSLGVFQEFRQMYDNCLKKLEGTPDGSATLKKLAPFKKLIDDLWEQNTMLVETVEELEQEATSKVTNLQDRLNKSCQKELHCMLRTKEREVECMKKELLEKDDLIKKYGSQVEELKLELKNKCSKYREILKQLKSVKNEDNKMCDNNFEEDLCEGDPSDLEELLQLAVKSVEDQRKSMLGQFQNAECQIKALSAEKKIFLKERSEIANQLQRLKSEKEKLLREVTGQKRSSCEKEELIRTIEMLKSEKTELMEKVNTLHNNIQELNKNFKETRWALTSEVAEKHDQVQELKRCVGALEDQLRQADMQTHFKDDIIKELRKELKASKKSLSSLDNLSSIPSREHCPPAPLSSTILCSSQKKLKDDELKVDIHIFPISENKGVRADQTEEEKYLSSHSVEVQTEVSRSPSATNIRNVATQHKTRVQKLPRSFGTLTVTPWSGAAGESNSDDGGPENDRRGLYDVVNEVKGRKNEGTSNVTFVSANGGASCDMNNSSSASKCRDGGYYSTTSVASGRGKNDLNAASVSDSHLASHYAALASAVARIEEILRTLSLNQNCGLSDCKTILEEEMEKINLVKLELEKNRSKSTFSKYSDRPSGKQCDCSESGMKCSASSFRYKCSLIHIQDIEKFREKAVIGVVALEQMKEQIEILENLIKRYVEEFPCDCDKSLVEECEEKLEKLHLEFDDITDQLCCALQQFSNSRAKESVDAVSIDEEKEISYQGSYSGDDISNISRFKSEYQRLQKEICHQENTAEKLKIMTKQLEEEVQRKKCQLNEQAREMESRAGEISKFRELIRRVSRRLKEIQNGGMRRPDSGTDSLQGRNDSPLAQLFSDLQELWFLLEVSMDALTDGPSKLKEENEKLREKLECLEKCVGNKEESLRFLQETVKLRECQIEELKSRMQSSEHHSSKLAQDVEEKCRLIANLQEAVRKCKQFEVYAEVLESLQFEYCELNCKLRKLQKEKTVNELQEELGNRECEVEGLYGKIKDLENELEMEFKKCEERAAEDSKCIEDLSATLKKFQKELYCSNESYNMSIIETENRLKKEMEMREDELKDTICRLKSEISDLRSQLKDGSAKNKNSTRSAELDCLFKQVEIQQELYEKKLVELQKTLDCASEEHEEERKSLLQKLCEEKNANIKNKTEITRLNESIKRKTVNERALKECIEHFTEDNNNLKCENQELKTELEARKKVMCAMEKGEGLNLMELEELICSLKIQKAELKARCCNLKAELDKEVKQKTLLKCQVEELDTILQNKMQEVSQMTENYKCTVMRVRETQAAMKELEENLMCSGSNDKDLEKLNKLVDIKTAENAKLLCQIEILKVEMESIQNENAALQANKDALISGLQHEMECLESDIQEFQGKCQRMSEENQKLRKQLENWTEKEAEMQKEFKEKQKELCGKLRTTLCEKNDLLNSLDELQRQLEEICLENVNREKLNRELSEECSRLKINNGSRDNHLRNKSDKIICNLSKELKNLHCDLAAMKDNYNILNEDYQSLLEHFNCCEKKRANIEKLYMEVSEENKELQESRAKHERELCELKTQNSLLKDKIGSKGEYCKNSDDKRKMCDKIKELNMKIKTLEKKVIPELEHELAEKNCCIENLKIELREANISCQKMRNEALRMIQHTKKYLAAQRCANDALKARLECSNKRGSILGAENRELEEQLKAVTQMNEFLLCQLEVTKNNVGGAEPRSFSPLPWGCSVVERDTSSSEYLAESGIQSMQPSPTNLDYHDSQCDFKRNSPQWTSLKKYKYGGSTECPSYRNGLR